MGLLGYLNNVNQRGGGRGILINPIVNALSRGSINKIESQGQALRQDIVRRASDARAQKNFMVSGLSSVPQTTTTPNYDQRYTNFMNNVNKGRAKLQAQVPQDLRDAVTKVSSEKSIPPEILYALANKESNFRNIPENSGIGAQAGRGYFQIDRTYHPNVSDQQAYDPYFSAGYAADLLNSRLNRYNTVTNAIRAYNGSITNPKTKEYYNKYVDYLGNYKY